MRINLVGNIFGSSGYAAHTRGLFNALNEIAEVKLETGLVPGWEAEVNDAELAGIKREHFNDDVSVMIGLPPYWESAKNEPCSRFYGFCVWEGDKVPRSFLPGLKAADAVLVPSQHVAQAIWNTLKEETDGSQLKVAVVPHGVDTALFCPPEPNPEAPERPFVFLANKGWAQGIVDRGGLQFVFKAFAEEFRKSENVSLRVKINAAYMPPGWNVGAELAKLNLPTDRPEFLIMTDTIQYRGLPKFYSEGDVFLSPTMAEGFSIPCAEAMSCGVPVITTDFGGQTDFVNEENGWIVKTDPFEVEHDVMYEGIHWAMPRLADLRATMRFAYENRALCKIKGQKAREDIAAGFTWRNSARKLLDFIIADVEGERK